MYFSFASRQAVMGRIEEGLSLKSAIELNY